MLSEALQRPAGNHKKWPFSMPNTVVMGAFLFALILRAAYLIFLRSLNWPDQWFHVDRASFIMSMHMNGLPISADLERQLVDLLGAQQEFQLNDPGLTYLFYFVGKLVGHPSFVAVQWAQVVVDAFIVFPIAHIGRSIGGERCGKWSAYCYAMFLPQIYINAMPHYSTWLTYGYVVTLALFLVSEKRETTRRWALFSVGCAIIFITSLLRSTISFFGIAYVLLTSAGELIFNRKLLFRRAAIGLLLALFFVIVRSKIDFSGEGIPVRSTIAHSLMVGVGQFDNPLGLVGNDGSPFEWYKRENPGAVKRLEQYSAPTNSPEYNAWLMVRFKKFVAEHPVLYAVMVMKRGLMILIPNFKISPYADSAQYAILYRERNDEITALSGKLYSLATGLGEKARILARISELELSYVFLLPFRLLIMFLLPLGVISAFCLSRDKRSLVAPLAPLIYTVATVSLVYGPGQLHISAWAVTLPVVALGWLSLWDYFGRFKRKS